MLSNCCIIHPPHLIGELAEVAGGDESQPALLQTVPGQLDYLVVGEAEHAICQREDALWSVAPDDFLNPFLHLSRGLREEGDGVTLARRARGQKYLRLRERGRMAVARRHSSPEMLSVQKCLERKCSSSGVGWKGSWCSFSCDEQDDWK
ncbi:hypothetical protein EYF80_028536 [Liparis tanakae]|uniref:Uncharacterized protein n=1 Tax=Liparis tanakae TaxID=230148 RepID=A0A4Z2H6G5_9TELE|nr:hypothetical protein EYF80_028536 [Liparis tanakae]